ncbi:Trefoil factor 3 [Apophysomyces ossiformis]|uniref:Trefoil factor 3 n=1 Tax=Apophysomyces ossiformis TaxID=679940 RepID=A0A8H7BVZ8_9FUNG|nr:Trefoil factor 3 [Apophysomyces ossiformis]
MPAENDQTHSATEDEEYEVEAILDHRRMKGRGKQLQYRIKWKGYPDEDNTWEKESNVSADLLVEEYWSNKGGAEGLARAKGLKQEKPAKKRKGRRSIELPETGEKRSSSVSDLTHIEADTLVEPEKEVQQHKDTDNTVEPVHHTKPVVDIEDDQAALVVLVTESSQSIQQQQRHQEEQEDNRWDSKDDDLAVLDRQNVSGVGDDIHSFSEYQEKESQDEDKRGDNERLEISEEMPNEAVANAIMDVHQRSLEYVGAEDLKSRNEQSDKEEEGNSILQPELTAVQADKVTETEPTIEENAGSWQGTQTGLEASEDVLKETEAHLEVSGDLATAQSELETKRKLNGDLERLEEDIRTESEQVTDIVLVERELSEEVSSQKETKTETDPTKQVSPHNETQIEDSTNLESNGAANAGSENGLIDGKGSAANEQDRCSNPIQTMSQDDESVQDNIAYDMWEAEASDIEPWDDSRMEMDGSDDDLLVAAAARVEAALNARNQKMAEETIEGDIVEENASILRQKRAIAEDEPSYDETTKRLKHEDEYQALSVQAHKPEVIASQPEDFQVSDSLKDHVPEVLADEHHGLVGTEEQATSPSAENNSLRKAPTERYSRTPVVQPAEDPDTIPSTSIDIDSEDVIFDPNYPNDDTLDWNEAIEAVELIVRKPDLTGPNHAVVRW